MPQGIDRDFFVVSSPDKLPNIPFLCCRVQFQDLLADLLIAFICIQRWDFKITLDPKMFHCGKHGAIPALLDAVFVFLLLTAGHGDEETHLKLHHCLVKLGLVLLAETTQGLELM